VKKPLVIKLAIGAIAIAIFAVLFMQSIEDTRSEAYIVDRAHLQPWTLALEQAARPNDPLLVLRAPPDLPTGVFKQIFARAMESLNSPTIPSVPVVLRGEYDRIVGDQFTELAMLDTAKAAGIASAAPPSPRCLVHRRVSEPGGVRQAYFIFFDAPAIVQFRRQLGLDADVLSPVMAVAGAGTDFNSWLPLRVNADTDCLAPIEVTS
jgi:hypothetical protein